MSADVQRIPIADRVPPGRAPGGVWLAVLNMHGEPVIERALTIRDATSDNVEGFSREVREREGVVFAVYDGDTGALAFAHGPNGCLFNAAFLPAMVRRALLAGLS
jgi:hypothetical protein